MPGSSSGEQSEILVTESSPFAKTSTTKTPLATKEIRVPASKPTPAETKKEKKPLRFDDLSAQDQLIIIQEIENSVIYFIEMGFPVYLEGLGILFPKFSNSRRVKNLRDKYVLYSEEYRTIAFEKCYELVSLHREKFSGVLDTKDLSERVFERSSPFLSTPFSAGEMRRFVRGMIDKLRKEVVNTGRSYLLQTIGDFYALHNRQGATFADWYAGADIFLKARYQRTIKTNPSRFLNRPIFFDAIEPFTALYGDPIREYSVNLKSELTKLGFEINNTEQPDIALTNLKIAAFSTPDPERDGAVLITYVTDKLRSIGLSKANDNPCGTEFVVQTVIEPESSFGLKSKTEIDSESLPSWPIQLITAGWILLHSSKTGRVKPGAGLAVGAKGLFEDENVQLSTLFTTKFSKIAGEQLSSEGAFEFTSLIAITDDEAEVAAMHTPHLLMTLLGYKNLLQISKPNRSSIVAKTGLLAPFTAVPLREKPKLVASH